MPPIPFIYKVDDLLPRRLKLLVILAVGVAIGGFTWQGARLARWLEDARHSRVEFVREPVTLARDVHMLGGLAPSVAYAIETAAGVVLIDAGLDADGARLREQLAELRLDESDITAILLTHVHGDHTLGARALRDLSQAKVYAGREDSQPLRDGGPRDAIFSTFPMEGVPVHGTPVDIELVGGEVLDFGDARIEVLATPGHTPGSLCYLLHLHGQRFLFGGDTISSLIGDLGTYTAYLAPRYRGNATDYLASLRTLRAMPAPDLILPGHPTQEGQPHSPRLSESDWHALLDRGIEKMETLVGRFEADGRDFLDGHTKEILPGLYYLGDYQSRTLFVWDTGQHQLLFDAPGDDDLATFVEDQLVQAGIDEPQITGVFMTSCEPEATGGLASVVAKWNCPVVVDTTGRSILREIVAESLTWLEPNELPGVSVETIELDNVNAGTVAYAFAWQDRKVLVSGNIPSTLGHTSRAKLEGVLATRRVSWQDFRTALDDLRPVAPDVWLPAYPKNGQNANLYDDQWQEIVQQNLQQLRP